MKTVDVFAVKEEVGQRSTSAQTLMVVRLLHALGPVVRNELQPSVLSPDRERSFPLALRWPLFPTVR